MLPFVLASGNPGKLREINRLLEREGIQVIPQSDFGVGGVEEPGLTFVENAILKARVASRAAGLPAIADDSGLEVDALGGAPGVRSARFAGEDADAAANNRILLERLEAIGEAERAARFRCVMVCMRHPEDPAPIICEGAWEGRIAREPSGQGGFGYDPLFLPRGYEVSAACLSPDEKNRVSHRGRALRCLVEALGRFSH
jgi:XTP/dITP diphosphohydrolase